MEENEIKQEPSINTDELKNETVNTVNHCGFFGTFCIAFFLFLS